MRLWSIQSPCRLAHLSEHGVLHGDWDYLRNSEDDFYIRPYKWMAKAMAARLPEFSGKAPIWAWPKKYDLRLERWQWGDKWKVCIEFEAPDDRVVLSDYDLWHSVLNDFPVSLTEAEHNAYFERYDERNKYLIDVRGFGYRKAGRWTEREFQREKEVSWDRIFDPDLPWDDQWLGEGPRRWQATLDGLQEEWVTGVRVFRSRSTKWP